MVVLQSSKFSTLNLATQHFEDRVHTIINHIAKNNQYLNEISKTTGIDYSVLKNSLSPDDFKKSITNAHLGAHKSTAYLTKEKMEDLALKSGFFIVVVNEMINNPNIK